MTYAIRPGLQRISDLHTAGFPRRPCRPYDDLLVGMKKEVPFDKTTKELIGKPTGYLCALYFDVQGKTDTAKYPQLFSITE